MAKIVIESMQTLIDSKINNLKFNKKRKAVIQSLNEDGTVDITINDEVFENVDVRVGLLPQVGEVVKVEIPNNSIRDMFIDITREEEGMGIINSGYAKIGSCVIYDGGNASDEATGICFDAGGI